jgi:hypothetical protein
MFEALGVILSNRKKYIMEITIKMETLNGKRKLSLYESLKSNLGLRGIAQW